jgi:Ca2+/Na+ antiporter
VIRKAILVAAVIYLAINAVQVAMNPSVMAEGLGLAVVVLLALFCYYQKRHGQIELWELGVLWASVLIFVVYMAVKLGGLV